MVTVAGGFQHQSTLRPPYACLEIPGKRLVKGRGDIIFPTGSQSLDCGGSQHNGMTPTNHNFLSLAFQKETLLLSEGLPRRIYYANSDYILKPVCIEVDNYWELKC